MLTLDLIFLSPLPSSSYGRNFMLCAATVIQEGHILFPHIITCIKDVFLLVSKFRKPFFSGLINGSSMQPMTTQRSKDFHLMAYFWTLWNPWVRSLNKNPIFQMMMYSNKNANSETHQGKTTWIAYFMRSPVTGINSIQAKHAISCSYLENVTGFTIKQFCVV